MKIFFVASSSVGHMKRAREVMRRYPGEVCFLKSFAYWTSPNAFKYWAWLRRNGDEFMVDSGAYTYLAADGTLDIPYPDCDSYIDHYFRYLRRIEPLWDRFVELDLYKLFGVEFIIDTTWPRMFSFQRETGKYAIFVWHKELGEEGWRRMLENPEVRWVGLNKDLGYGNFPLWRRMVGEAKDYGKKIHGFAAVRRPLLEAVDIDSADSTTAFTTTDKFGQSEFYDSRVDGHGYMITKNSLRSLKRTLKKAGGNTKQAHNRHLRELKHHMDFDIGGRIDGRRASKDAMCVENICHLVEMQREVTRLWEVRSRHGNKDSSSGGNLSEQLEPKPTETGHLREGEGVDSEVRDDRPDSGS